MKSLLTTVVFLASAVASANCPELTGNYSCSTQQGIIDLQIAQMTENNVTVYQLFDGQDVSQIVADNVEKPFEDKDYGITGSIRTTCEENALRMYQKAQATDPQTGKVSESVDMIQDMKLENKDILVITNGTHKAFNPDGVVETPITDTIVCTAK